MSALQGWGTKALAGDGLSGSQRKGNEAALGWGSRAAGANLANF